MTQTTATRPDARERILEAACALAAEFGPGNISIDAVAARAGLSKGGVLYHFRAKTDLLAAVVQSHIDRSAKAIDDEFAAAAGPNALAVALIAVHREEDSAGRPPAAGVLAAIAENPDLLDPLREHHSGIVNRLDSESADPDLATIVYLALEGLKAHRLFGFDATGCRSEKALLARMEQLLREAS
ncbi:TetR/AcrR family transcriptional regulator [Roseitranquillus sediminis]|uniref:TetR/AcrR family transcriptional regulator n=1 Tax=Roseitranquillus sediminis TaxID=2809051 RepID=UPI001D0CA6E6|nr:TetR/AcrR family transcriptional regulator [Roseitranquillus sediminis]MBM9594576.1 TetR/AcrR family transcriptional regulator [Roseitranquillus sediminis]